MTLITAFKNDDIAFIAGDGAIKERTIDSKSNKVIFKFNIGEKVFKCGDLIAAISDVRNNCLEDWLREGYKENTDGEIDKRLDCQIKLAKEISNCNKHSSLNYDKFSIIYYFDNIFVLNCSYPPSEDSIYAKKTIVIYKDNIKCIGNSSYFFSPQLLEDNEAIDLEHQKRIEKLFLQSFKEIYNTDFNSSLITNDCYLKKFIEKFYLNVYADELAHKNVIGGRVSYCVYSNNECSDINYIEIELPQSMPEKYTYE